MQPGRGDAVLDPQGGGEGALEAPHHVHRQPALHHLLEVLPGPRPHGAREGRGERSLQALLGRCAVLRPLHCRRHRLLLAPASARLPGGPYQEGLRRRRPRPRRHPPPGRPPAPAPGTPRGRAGAGAWAIARFESGQGLPQPAGDGTPEEQDIQGPPEEAGGVGQAQAQARVPRLSRHQDQAQPGPGEGAPGTLHVHLQEPGSVDVGDAVPPAEGARSEPPRQGQQGPQRPRARPLRPHPVRLPLQEGHLIQAQAPRRTALRAPPGGASAAPRPNHSGQRSWATMSPQTVVGGASSVAPASMRVTNTSTSRPRLQRLVSLPSLRPRPLRGRARRLGG